MKIMHRTIGVTVVSILLTGCVNPNGTQNNTGTGALIGGAVGALTGAAIGGHRHGGMDALMGAAAGALAGGLIGHLLDQQQQAQLRQNSPQTLNTIQHNDDVYAHYGSAAAPPPPPPPPSANNTSTQSQPPPAPPAANQMSPLTVDDIKQLAAAGVKSEAITKEIEMSKSVYTQQDIAAAQQANVDPAVIDCMKKTMAG